MRQGKLAVCTCLRRRLALACCRASLDTQQALTPSIPGHIAATSDGPSGSTSAPPPPTPPSRSASAALSPHSRTPDKRQRALPSSPSGSSSSAESSDDGNQRVFRKPKDLKLPGWTNKAAGQGQRDEVPAERAANGTSAERTEVSDGSGSDASSSGEEEAAVKRRRIKGKGKEKEKRRPARSSSGSVSPGAAEFRSLEARIR